MPENRTSTKGCWRLNAAPRGRWLQRAEKPSSRDVRVRSNRDSRYQQMLSAFPPTAPASVKTLRAVRELLSILDRSGFEFSRSRFLADPLTRHPPKPVCLDFDVRLRQSVGMSGVGMSRARAQVHKFTVSRE